MKKIKILSIGLLICCLLLFATNTNAWFSESLPPIVDTHQKISNKAFEEVESKLINLRVPRIPIDFFQLLRGC